MKLIKTYSSLLLIIINLLYFTQSFAAAPDDINVNQRAWFDAVDVNANGNYTDNPANGSSIGTWSDKSGLGQDVSSSGTSNPNYVTSSPSSQRNGLNFDGVNDYLQNSDIWNGNVSNSEIFVMATTDRAKNSFLFASQHTHRMRISTHIPWSNGTTYFDHGNCCGNPSRLNGNISISFATPYNWHFIGLTSLQAVIQDGATLLSDSGVGIYTPSSTSKFAIARSPFEQLNYHDGMIYEFIAYQRGLNLAERRIMSSYLSAKWGKTFAAAPTYADVYAGDLATNGQYDFFVGGIGRQAGMQATGTSQGLTISDNNFLSSDGKYVVAGVNYLTTTPLSGTVTTDLPANYSSHSNRSWYIDTTGSGGTVNLSFSASAIGIPVVNGDDYGLLYRSGTSGAFTEVSTATMSGGNVLFNHLPADGVYTVGKKTGKLSLKKTSCVISDSFNGTTNSKRIPGATVRYMFEVKNYKTEIVDNAIVEDPINTSNLNSSSIKNLQIQAGPCDCLAVTPASNNGVNGSANSVMPVKLDFDTIPAGNSTTPTVKCGYFEIDIL